MKSQNKSKSNKNCARERGERARERESGTKNKCGSFVVRPRYNWVLQSVSNLTTASIELFVSRLDDSVCDDWCWFLHWALPHIYTHYIRWTWNKRFIEKNLPFFLFSPSSSLSIYLYRCIVYTICMCVCIWISNSVCFFWLRFGSLLFRFSSNL